MQPRRTWRGNVQVNTPSAAALGIRELKGFVNYVLANLGGGGGGSDPSCPPCVGPAVNTYDAAGRLTTIQYGSPVQVTTTITRNAAGQITETETVWAAGTRTCTHTYNAAGRRTGSECAFVAA